MLQGIAAHVDEILSDLSLVNVVHESKLLLFAWGEPTNSNETLTELRSSGIDGVIHDWSVRLPFFGSLDRNLGSF